MLLAGFEGAARIAPESATATRDAVVRAALGEQALYASDAVPGWDLAAGGGQQGGVPYHSDAWRMRGEDVPATKGSHDWRVVFVGDSSVFGHALAWPETFEARFERRRDAAGSGWDTQVGACAAPGHSTVQSRLKLERHCLAFQPDVVVIGNQYSDSTLALLPDAVRFDTRGPSPALATMEHLASYRLLRNLWLRRVVYADLPSPEAIAQVGLDLPGDIPRVSVADYQDNLAAMIALVRGAGAAPVLLTLPARSDVRHADKEKPYTAYRAAMREVAEELGVQLVDAPTAYRPYAGREDLFLDRVHPSSAGAVVLAELLDAELPRPLPR